MYALRVAVSHSQPLPKDRTVAKSLRRGADCDYEKELRRLQVELVKFQEWVQHKGFRWLWSSKAGTEPEKVGP